VAGSADAGRSRSVPDDARLSEVSTFPTPRPPDPAPNLEAEALAREADCRTCPLRARCITWGWRSPGGLWFENAVVLRPSPGCRGWIGRGPDIRRRFSNG
jgi:hypothetical protein